MTSQRWQQRQKKRRRGRRRRRHNHQPSSSLPAAVASFAHNLLLLFAALPAPLLLLLPPLPRADAFAAWLVNKASGCWTDLDVSDVIMNAHPKPPSESSHPGVVVRAYDKDTGEEVKRSENGVIALSGNDGKPWEYNVRMYIPPESRGAGELADVQYVVSTGDETSGGKFTGPNSGCGGSRAHGRGNDRNGIPFEIASDAFDEKYGEDGRSLGKQREVEVWAGWATEHAAVQLTEKLTFRLEADAGGGAGDNGTSEGENNGEAFREENAEEEKKKMETAAADAGGYAAKAAEETDEGEDDRRSADSDAAAAAKKAAKREEKLTETKREALDRMADFRRDAAGQIHQHHGAAGDAAREEIIRNQMGLKDANAAAIDRDPARHAAKVMENVQKVGELMKKQRDAAAEGLAAAARNGGPGGRSGGAGKQKEWDEERIKQGLNKMAQERARTAKEMREEKARRYGPGTERKRGGGGRGGGRARRTDDDDGDGNDEDDDDSNDGKGGGVLPAARRFRRRYRRDDFGGGTSFRTGGYLFGMVLIVVFVAGVTRYARVADRRWNKGARIL